MSLCTAFRRWHAGAVVLATLLATSSLVHAQAQALPPIEQQMSADEFKSAGLDRLSTEQLARLNQWLGRTVQAEASKAAEVAKQEVVEKNRGFHNFGSEQPLKAMLPGEFRGFARGRQYTLDNGQVWQQIDDAKIAGVRLDNPTVQITPSLIGNAWYLVVGKYNTRAQVKRIK